MQLFAFIALGFLLLIAIVSRAMVIWGAVRMLQGKSYRLAVTGSVLAMIPCSPIWLLTLPSGIWALAVLSRREVKAAFGPTPAAHGERGRRAR